MIVQRSEIKKAVGGFTPTQKTSWPGDGAPPRKPESGAAEVHHKTRGEHAKANRILDSREEAEKARQEDHCADPGTSIEAKYATGFSRQAGKHRAHTGPLTRGSGRLKIFPESRNREEVENELETLREIAKQVLHGRNGTVFDRHVIEPLANGTQHPPIEETAAQFNVAPKRVYKIIDKCWEKIREALPRFEEGRPLLREERSPVCTICRRHESSDAICPRGHYGGCDRRGFNVCVGGKYELHHDLVPGEAEEAMQAKSWRDYVTEVFQKWEDAYGPSRLDGPKRKVRESK